MTHQGLDQAAAFIQRHLKVLQNSLQSVLGLLVWVGVGAGCRACHDDVCLSATVSYANPTFLHEICFGYARFSLFDV